ncbi:PrpR N-terminal domain-containing protein [Metabacillus sp. SLBN-84]
MTIRVLFIAPYEAMTPLIKECAETEPDLELTIRTANLADAIPYAKRAVEDGYDAIISRGGTAKLIEKIVTIPVIDVHISGYDMLRVLTLASAFPAKKAMVGFPNITLGAQSITDLLDIPIGVFTVDHAEEVDDLVQKLKNDGYGLIIGDVITINAALRSNLEGILIQSGREAIFDAFQRIKSVHALYRKAQDELEVLKFAARENLQDYLVLNEKEEIVSQNWISFSGCPVPKDQVVSSIRENQEAESESVSVNIHDHIIQSRYTVSIGGQGYEIFAFSKISTDQSYHVERLIQQPNIIAESEAMKKCLSSIHRKRRFNLWVLKGDSGTGKKLISAYIHYMKHEGAGLFATVSAEAALKQRSKLDSDIRTVYLIGAETVSDDLHSLQTIIDEWRSSGRTVIVAFRDEDPLYYPIMHHEEGIRVTIPSLNQREEDLKPLVSSFIALFHAELGTSAVKIKSAAIDLLKQYDWPGNVLELKALIKDAVLEEKGYVIGAELISRLLSQKPEKQSVFDEAFLEGSLEKIEKRIIDAVMEQEDHNQTRVAERLKINRSTLWRKLKQ